MMACIDMNETQEHIPTNWRPRRNHTKDFIFVHFYNSCNIKIHPFEVNLDVFRLFNVVQPSSLPNFRILYHPMPSRSHSSLEIVYTNPLSLFYWVFFSWLSCKSFLYILETRLIRYMICNIFSHSMSYRFSFRFFFFSC